MRTLTKFILAAALAAPLFATGSAAYADSVVPQIQYPSVFWPEHNAPRNSYAYYPASREIYGARTGSEFSANPAGHCFYRNGVRTFAPGCHY